MNRPWRNASSWGKQKQQEHEVGEGRRGGEGGHHEKEEREERARRAMRRMGNRGRGQVKGGKYKKGILRIWSRRRRGGGGKSGQIKLHCTFLHAQKSGLCGMCATNWLYFFNYHWGALKQSTKTSKPLFVYNRSVVWCSEQLLGVDMSKSVHVIQTTNEKEHVCTATSGKTWVWKLHNRKKQNKTNKCRLTGSTKSNIFLSWTSCTLKTYSRDTS